MFLSRLVGNTPLIRISDRIFAKLETYNPSGSVKDRMVCYVVEKALDAGDIKKDTCLVEATSGNTGIYLSMVGASLGLDVTIIMPENMSEERIKMMRTYGANIVTVGPSDFEGAIALRDKMLLENPDSMWSPMQFSNPVNVQCHYEWTAPEIFSKVPACSAFIHGAGTGGTIMGFQRYIDKNDLSTKVVLVVPEEPSDQHGIQGIGDGEDFLVDRNKVDDVIRVSTEDAIVEAQNLAKTLGLLVGISSGANLVASKRWVESNNPPCPIVTMLCDRGERYLSVL